MNWGLFFKNGQSECARRVFFGVSRRKIGVEKMYGPQANVRVLCL